MSQAPIKIKRRIVPTQVIEEESKSPHVKTDKWDKKSDKHIRKAEMEGGQSVKYKKHLEALHDKDYHKKLNERANKLGYSGTSKATKSRASKEHVDHGNHGEHLHDMKEYVKEFVKMKAHSKGVSVYDYLKKQFGKGYYLSSATKRFRKLK